MEVNMNPDVLIPRIILGWYGGIAVLALIVGGLGFWLWRINSPREGDDTKE